MAFEKDQLHLAGLGVGVSGAVDSLVPVFRGET